MVAPINKITTGCYGNRTYLLYVKKKQAKKKEESGTLM